jgi:hypothetical protein
VLAARALEVACAPPPAAALPVVVARLPTVPVVVALPRTPAAPTTPPGTTAVPLAPAVAAVAPEVAVFKLVPLPVPELAAPEKVLDDAFVAVTAIAGPKLVSAATAMAMRVFFMIDPIKKWLPGAAGHGCEIRMTAPPCYPPFRLSAPLKNIFWILPNALLLSESSFVIRSRPTNT